MGEVYKASDTRVHDRTVAVKVLVARLAASEQAVRRFETEVRIAATLNHLNIVSILDRGEAEDGRPYFVMEHLDGVDLKGYTTGKIELSLEQRLELGAQSAEALGYAHGRGIVHRDVKPSNIFVVRQGDHYIAKLLDFGIVHVEGSDLTQTTDQPGTSNYMAPEVLRGREATTRSDLFSFGIVLYELFTHTHPFQDTTQALILNRIMNDPPERLRKKNPDVPHEVESLVLQLLEKQPEQRSLTAQNVATALQSIARSVRVTGVSGTPSGFSSADQVTNQAVREFVNQARRFESEGQLAEARKLYQRALALDSENPKLLRKVEGLTHNLESGRRLDSLLKEIRTAIAADDRETAKRLVEEAWLIKPEDKRVIDLRENLSDDPKAAAPDLPAELVQALDAHYRGDGPGTVRRLLTTYLRKHPGDGQAVQALSDILAGRDPKVDSYRPPQAWTAEQRDQLVRLSERIRKAQALADGREALLRELGGLSEELAELEAGFTNLDGFRALLGRVEKLERELGGAISSELQAKSVKIRQLLEEGSGLLPLSLGEKAERVADAASRADLSAAPDRIGEAAESEQRLVRELEMVRGELADIAARIGSSVADRATSLSETARGLGREIAARLEDEIARVDGVDALDAEAVDRFRKVTTDLRTSDSVPTADRCGVGLDALETVRTAHGIYLARLNDDAERILAGVDSLEQHLTAQESTTVSRFRSKPLSERLPEARAAVDALAAVLSEARERVERERLARMAKARSALEHPWFEAEVGSVSRATEPTEALLLAARNAQRLKTSIEKDLGGRRIDDLESRLSEARGAAEASRGAHEQAAARWTARLPELERRVAQFNGSGMPGKVRQLAEKIRVPQPGADGPRAIREFVQQASRARHQIEGLEGKVEKLIPAKLRQAEELHAKLKRPLSGLRLPRISSDLRGEIEQCRDSIGAVLEQDDPRLPDVLDVLGQGRAVADRVPRNWLPGLIALVVGAVIAAGAWFVMAPRTVILTKGLAVASISFKKGDRELLPDHGLTFKVPPGKYQIEYEVEKIGAKSDSETRIETIEIRPLSLPFVMVRPDCCWDSYENRIKEILELPQFQGP